MAGPGGPAAQRSDSRRGAAAIVAALAGAGTRLMFGVPGGGPNLDVVGAAAAAGMSFVLAHGETAATIMAATCADLTGAPGAVVVTRGPGLASAVNGIAHAALDRLPVVVIADTVPGHQRDRVSHQRLDQAALGRSVAKVALTAGPGQPEQAAHSPSSWRWRHRPGRWSSTWTPARTPCPPWLARQPPVPRQSPALRQRFTLPCRSPTMRRP